MQIATMLDKRSRNLSPDILVAAAEKIPVFAEKDDGAYVGHLGGMELSISSRIPSEVYVVGTWQGMEDDFIMGSYCLNAHDDAYARAVKAHERAATLFSTGGSEGRRMAREARANARQFAIEAGIMTSEDAFEFMRYLLTKESRSK